MPACRQGALIFRGDISHLVEFVPPLWMRDLFYLTKRAGLIRRRP